MEFAVNYRRTLTLLVVVACSSTLLWFGNSLNPVWPLMWLAPLPVLLFAARSHWLAAALATFLSWFIGGLTMAHYFSLVQVPVLLVCSVVALVFTGAVLLFRALLVRGAYWSALGAFPAVGVCFEYLLNRTGSAGTGGSLAYTQLHFLPFLQLASITGPWGMSFLLLLFPTAIAIGVSVRTTAPKQAMRVVGTSLGVLALVLVFGAWRLAVPSQQERVRVGLIAADRTGGPSVAAPGVATEALFGAYAAQAEQLAARGAKVVVIPEHLGVAVGSQIENTDALFQALADKTNSVIVAGLDHGTGTDRYNEARVYRPDATVMSYDKHHLLPPFESMFTPGRTLTTFHEPSGTWGVAICKDMDFTDLSRDYGHAGAGLLLVPAWDFNLDRSWHGHIAVMRGVEDGFSIVRSARNGYLTVSDDRGRVVAEARSDAAPFATLEAEVPVGHDATLYLLLGDWFAWVAVGVLAFAVLRLAGLVARRRAAKEAMVHA